MKKNTKNKINSGFVLLFSIMISSIILLITLGVSNIALKEINFTISAKDTNDAFFAADTGAECALFNDKTSGGLESAFIENGSGVSCLGTTITFTNPPSSSPWNFVLTGLGSTGKACAKVTVKKDIFDGLNTTTIISKGYNNNDTSTDTGCSPASNAVERFIELSYPS